jgi:hypothetical protein
MELPMVPGMELWVTIGNETVAQSTVRYDDYAGG